MNILYILKKKRNKKCDNFMQVKRIDDNSDIYAKELVLLVN